MKVTLSRKIPLEVFDAVTRMRISTPNPGLKFLCSIASENGGRISEEEIKNVLDLNTSSAKTLFRNGKMYGCWDSDGNLTDEGRMVKSTGEALLDERGDFRLWVLTDPTALFSPKLLHFDHLPEVPRDTKGKIMTKGENKTFLEIMKRRETHTSVVNKNRRFTLEWDSKSACKRSEKFSAGVDLIWAWSGDESIEFENHVSVEGKLKGVKQGSKDSLQGMKFPVDKPGDPDSMLTKWLSTGRFADGTWDSDIFALRRSFDSLDDEQKVRFTMNETLQGKEAGIDWERVVLTDVPLVAKDEREAKKWALFLLANSLSRYMRESDLSDELQGILFDGPFASINNLKGLHESIIKDVRNTASENRRAFWLAQASDDLNSSAMVTVAKSLKDRKENSLEFSNDEEYSNIIRELTSGMNGNIIRVLYCDQFIYSSTHYQKLKSIVHSMNDLDVQCGIDLLTVFDPFTKHERNHPDQAKQFLQEKSDDVNRKRDEIHECSSGSVTFQEEIWKEGLRPIHDRFLIFLTDKSEQRVWESNKGIVSNSEILSFHRRDLLDPMLQVWMNEVNKNE